MMQLALRTQMAALRHQRHHPVHGKPQTARAQDDGRLTAALIQANSEAITLLESLKNCLNTAGSPSAKATAR